MTRRPGTRRKPAPAAGPGTAGPRAPAAARWPGAAALGLSVAVAVALAWVALRAHPVGDYFTESDFYEYARGGELIRRGIIDPGRYGIIGPLYEFALAVAGVLTPHVFRFATLLSALSAGVVLACWHLVAARRAGAAAGPFAALLLATNPVFFRYGYTASTDMPALALQAVSAAALLAGARPRAFASGLFAGLAILTRYTGVFLVPVALAVLLARRDGRRALLVAWALGLALALAPWTAFSLSRGHFPGEGLVRNQGFYATESAARNVQDRPSGEEAGRGEPLSRVIVPRIGEHAIRDARELLGWPWAALAAVGVVLVLRPRRAGRPGAWPVVLHAAVAFVVLLGSFYSDRYSMTLAPALAVVAGLALATLFEWRAARFAGPALATLLALGVATAAARRSVALQGFVRSQLPVEVLPAARALRELGAGDKAVIARKAAIAHFSGARHVVFPRLRNLAELADYARRERATHLFFSWYEGELRPEFWYLLDSTAKVPGLAPVFETAHHPSVLFEIGEGFGVAPPWFADTLERRVHEARGYVRVVGETEGYDNHRRLGVWSARRADFGPALDHFAAMTRGRPDRAEGWTLGGYVLLGMQRSDEARTWFSRAVSLEPRDGRAHAGLGLADWQLGRFERAAATFRPYLAELRDPRVLGELAAWYDAHGDPAGAAECRRRAGPPR